MLTAVPQSSVTSPQLAQPFGEGKPKEPGIRLTIRPSPSLAQRLHTLLQLPSPRLDPHPCLSQLLVSREQRPFICPRHMILEEVDRVSHPLHIDLGFVRADEDGLLAHGFVHGLLAVREAPRWRLEHVVKLEMSEHDLDGAEERGEVFAGMAGFRQEDVLEDVVVVGEVFDAFEVKGLCVSVVVGYDIAAGVRFLKMWSAQRTEGASEGLENRQRKC